ncbi:MAG TPA: hypothetical protein VF784_15080 [Anaerolineales bacterium]
MISTDDLLCLPFTPDLTEAGIRFACHSLPHVYERMGSAHFDRLRRIVAGISVELAFRRHLIRQNVPFDVKGAIPFTEPDRYDVSLGGHRCDIKSFLISRREQIRSLHASPAELLKAPGLVPLDQYAGDEGSAEDLYLFAFVTGLVTASQQDIQRACGAGMPAYFIHPMPSAWVRPSVWVPLGPLALKSECNEALTVEIGGQDASREFLTRTVELPPRTRVELDADFHSLVYLHAQSKPERRLGIHSSSRPETYLVQPVDWGNIWIYGMRIYLAGWIGRAEFRRRASLLYEGSRVFQYDHTRLRSLAVPVSDLRPVEELLARTRAWAGAHAPGGTLVR